MKQSSQVIKETPNLKSSPSHKKEQNFSYSCCNLSGKGAKEGVSMLCALQQMNLLMICYMVFFSESI